MGSVLVIDIVEQGEVVEHGLLALVDQLEVRVHRPVSCVGASVAVALRAGRDTAAVPRAGRFAEARVCRGCSWPCGEHEGCCRAEPGQGHNGNKNQNNKM